MSKRLNHSMREELIRHLVYHFSHKACAEEFDSLKLTQSTYADLIIAKIREKHASLYSLADHDQYLVYVDVAYDNRLNVRSYAMGSVDEQASIREFAMRLLKGFRIEPMRVPACYLLEGTTPGNAILDLEKVEITDKAVLRSLRIKAEIIKDTAMQIAKRAVADNERCAGLVQHSFSVKQVDKELLGTLKERLPADVHELFFGKTRAQLYAERRAVYGAEVRAYGGIEDVVK